MRLSAISIFRYARVYRLFFINSFNLLMSHRFNLLMSALANILWTVGQVVALQFLVSKIKSFAGWSLGDLLMLLAVGQIFFYFSYMVYDINLDEFYNKIIKGELDRYLLKPINLKFIISFETISVAQFIPLATTVLPLFILAFMNNPTNDWRMLFPAIGLLSIGLVIQYFFSLGLAGFNFFLDNAQGLRDILIKGANDFIRVPLDILPGFMRQIFTFAIPFAFVSFYPTLIIKNGKVDYQVYLLALMVLVIFWCFQKAVWHYGLKHYNSTGS